jgi:hypothetical protein
MKPIKVGDEIYYGSIFYFVTQVLNTVTVAEDLEGNSRLFLTSLLSFNGKWWQSGW